MTLIIQSKHEKDVIKASLCDYYIGVGCDGSSTKSYHDQISRIIKDRVNQLEYPKLGHRVFCSFNGRRYNRTPFQTVVPYINEAVLSGCTLIADNTYDRNRSYNIGEREFYDYMCQLMSYEYNEYRLYNGYVVGYWVNKDVSASLILSQSIEFVL